MCVNTCIFAPISEDLNKRQWILTGAFLCFLFGFLTLLLSLLGLEFSYLAWIDRLPWIFPLLLKLILLFGGLILAYLASFDWKNGNRE